MNRNFATAISVGLFAACGRPTASTQQPRVSSEWGFTTYGLHVTIPPDPKGKVTYSENRAEWKIHGITLTAEKQLDGTFKLFRDATLLGIAKVGEHVEFTADGRLINRPISQ